MAEDKKPKKKTFSAGQRTGAQQWGIPGTKQKRANEVDDQGGMTLAGFLTRPARQGLNFLGDLTTGFGRNKADSYGTGLGDTLFGVTKGYYDEKNNDRRPGAKDTVLSYQFPTDRTPVGGAGNASQFRMQSSNPAGVMGSDAWIKALAMKAGRNRPGEEEGPVDESFADMLARAMSMFGGEGGGVSYDPQRQTARDNAATADANLAAMYAGLSDSIANDAGGIGTAYDQTGQRQQTITDQTGQSLQQGYQSGTDMLTQQAQALGIQEAVANQIQSGSTPAGDLAQRLADNTAAGQTAQTQNTTNRGAALQYNDVVKNAAQQEGAQQRAQRQADLQSILANIDVAEQEANQSSRSNSMNNAVSLAQWLYGNQTDERRYQDNLQSDAARLANERYIADLENQPQVGVDRVSAESVALLQELLGYSDPKQFQSWVQENPSGYASLAKLLS